MSTNPSYKVGSTPFIRTKSVTRAKERTLVESLVGGESIAYVIQPETEPGVYGTAVGSGSTPTEVTHWAEQPGIWAAIAKKTAGTPLDAGTYRIRWTVTIGGGTSVEDDELTIKA